MRTNGLKNPIFLFYILVFYVLIQFVWWLYLIFSLYGDVYKEPSEIRQKVIMLIGEGSVFLLILIVGIIIIRRAFKREVEVNRQQQNFLLSVTHELKTPIASVKLFLQTLKKRDLDEPKREELYDQSLSEIDRLDGLVGKMLATRSIENQNYFLNKKKLRFDQFLEELVNNLKIGILRNHEVQLTTEDVELNADHEALTSICLNLLENAVKYSPSESKIEIILKANGPNGCELQVKDQGRGVSDEFKSKVFEKFIREENELTRKSKGTGLGLYIVKYLCEQHGGKIWLSNNQPAGLIVTITFKNE